MQRRLRSRCRRGCAAWLARDDGRRLGRFQQPVLRRWRGGDERFQLVWRRYRVGDHTWERVSPGNLGRGPQPALDEEPTQHGRDGLFPVPRIVSGPPMADAVVAVTI